MEDTLIETQCYLTHLPFHYFLLSVLWHPALTSVRNMLFVMTFVVCHDVILLYTLWFAGKKISLLD